MKLKSNLQSFGEILALTPRIAVLKKEGIEISVFPSGKLLIKTEAGEDGARKLASGLYSALGVQP